jgi:exosortase
MTQNSYVRACARGAVPYMLFASLCAIATAALFRPLAATLSLALGNDEFTHILLILPMSAVLIASQWNWLKSQISPSPQIGAALLATGIAIALIARKASAGIIPDARLSLDMLALVTLWIAAFVICFGRTVAKSSIFPLCFLLWMVPIPSFALTRIVQWLQTGSTLSASLLFSAAGVPSWREGVVLFIPGLSIEVARECSSLRSSLMLLVTTMVLTHSLLRSPWGKALVVLLAIPLSVAKNGLRIFVISMLGTRINRDFLTGWLHQQGGIVFFLIALAVILAAIWFLRSRELAYAHDPKRYVSRVEPLSTPLPIN